jgi:hypothetical protein
MSDSVRRYSIEIKDIAADQSVLLTAADWTKEEVEAVIAQVMRLAGLPDGAPLFTVPRG